MQTLDKCDVCVVCNDICVSLSASDDLDIRAFSVCVCVCVCVCECVCVCVCSRLSKLYVSMQ